MKFKLLAIAAVMAVSGAANAAAIDNGAAGNGGLMLNVWDASNSYTLNLTDAAHPNITIDGFQTIVGTGLVDLTWNADALFTSFLSTANLASLQWNVVAGEGMGARRMLDTFTSPSPSSTKTNDVIRTAVGGLLTATNNVNVALTGSTNSAVFALGTAGYAGKLGNNAGGLLNFNNAGTVANNTFASGLNFMRIDALATGVLKSTYTTYAVATSDVKVYLDSANALHIAAVAAVPEPETYAMLMAGLGLMGAIARRRNKKSA